MQINLVSKPGDTVIDFCSGTGEFTVCGLALGRNMMSFEAERAQFNLIKSRLKSFSTTITVPMLEPVNLPACLMMIDEVDSREVTNGTISSDQARYFLADCLMTVEPLDFGGIAWGAVGQKPPTMDTLSKEFERDWSACKHYRVRNE